MMCTWTCTCTRRSFKKLRCETKFSPQKCTSAPPQKCTLPLLGPLFCFFLCAAAVGESVKFLPPRCRLNTVWGPWWLLYNCFFQKPARRSNHQTSQLKSTKASAERNRLIFKVLQARWWFWLQPTQSAAPLECAFCSFCGHSQLPAVPMPPSSPLACSVPLYHQLLLLSSQNTVEEANNSEDGTK